MDLGILLVVQDKELGVQIFWVNTVSNIFHSKCPMKMKF